MFGSSPLQLLRSLRRSPIFVFGVVLIFGLGIGLNAAIFAVLDAVLIEPLPLLDPERLVEVFQAQPDGSVRPVAPANFLDWRRMTTSFAGLSSYHVAPKIVRGRADGDGSRRETAIVSRDFFRTLGGRALLGRLDPADVDTVPGGGAGALSSAGRPAAIVLGESLWREAFGADEAIVGRRVSLDGQSVEVIGVVPRSFTFPPDAGLWEFAPKDVAGLRMAMDLDPTTLRDARYLGVYGRLRPGVSLAAARAEMLEVGRQLSVAYPDANREPGILVDGLQERSGRPARPTLALLGAAALAVLLLANLNLANLFLVRAARRQRELDLRVALGAGRLELVADAALEALALALAGGLIGVLVAVASGRVLVAWLPEISLLGREVRLSLSVVGWIVAATAVSALVTATGPALSAFRRARSSAHEARTVGHRRGDISRRGLVAAQAALGLVLVLGAMLLSRSVGRLQSAPVGYTPAGAWAARLSLAAGGTSDAASRRRSIESAVEALAAMPGVERVGTVQKLPLQGAGMSANLRIEGSPDDAGVGPDVEWRAVAGDYFGAMRIAVVRGRAIEPSDAAASRPVAVVNRRLARILDPAEDVIGRGIQTGIDGERGHWVRVVGVVEDTPQEAVGVTAKPEMYRPLSQAERFGAETTRVVVRASRPPSLAALTAAARRVAPDVVVDDLRPLDAMARDSFARQRIVARLLLLFAAMALTLAASGVHSVVALGVERRRRELGVRLAVGARAADLARLVIAAALRPVVLGLGLGAALAFVAVPIVRGWLFGVTFADPISLIAAPCILLLVAFCAAFMPARKAARLEPSMVLREE